MQPDPFKLEKRILSCIALVGEASKKPIRVQQANVQPHRTVTPDRFVYIRAAMFIDASSWNRSLAA